MSSFKENYCVYIHIFPNKKIYVGITQLSTERRWRYDGSGYKRQPLIWRAICKYGWENVEHEIIAENLPKQEAENLEIYLIDMLKSNKRENGYNIANGGQTCGSHSKETIDKMKQAHLGEKNPNYGKRFSEDTCNKLSLSHKNKKLGSDNPASKSVLCVETGMIFPTISSASSFIGKQHASIDVCLKNANRTAGGYHWKYNISEVNKYG